MSKGETKAFTPKRPGRNLPPGSLIFFFNDVTTQCAVVQAFPKLARGYIFVGRIICT